MTLVCNAGIQDKHQREQQRYVVEQVIRYNTLMNALFFLFQCFDELFWTRPKTTIVLSALYYGRRTFFDADPIT